MTLGTVIGTIVSLCTIGFVDSILWLNEVLIIAPSVRIQYEETPLLLTSLTILVPAIGGLIVGLIFKFFSTSKRNLGPADSLIIVQLRKSTVSIKDGIVSTFASLLSLGAGASVGQYGPLVYLGTLIGLLTDKLKLNIPEIRSIGVAAGVAAAIAAAFNAPLAGLVFAHEVILRHYAIRAFAPTALAAAIAFYMSHVAFQRPPLFVVYFSGINFSYEYVLFAIVGVLGAFVATIIVRSMLSCAAFAKKLNLPDFIKPMCAGILLGVVALQLPEVLGIGRETLRFATIDGAFTTFELILIITAKLSLTIICLSFGFAGGIFSPVLLIGMLFGALFGNVLNDLDILAYSGVVPYAISGMMAVTSAVIGAPLTTILIVLELTRSYELVAASMVAVVFSNLISYRLFGRSLYDLQIASQGYDLTSGRLSAILANIPITNVMQDDYIKFNPSDTVKNAVNRFQETKRSEAVVTRDDHVYLGLLTLNQCVNQDPNLTVDNLVEEAELRFDESLSIRWAVDWLINFVGEIVPVVSSIDGKLLGVVTEGKVLETYYEVAERLRHEENESL